jgi:hypothetical protein
MCPSPRDEPAVPADPARETALARAEARGKQVLVYAPQGPLGGVLGCSRCGASALQPDLIDHRDDCPYYPSRRR